MKPNEFLFKIFKIQARNKSCYFCISTLDDKWKDHVFKWPSEKPQIKKLFKNVDLETTNIYFCPQPFRDRKRSKRLSKGSYFLWSDLDYAKPSTCNPIPQISWRTSKNRYSCLWKIDYFLEPEVVEKLNRDLAYANGADKSGWDLTQVLRVPGTKNIKYDSKPLVRLLKFKNHSYSIGDIPEYKESKTKIDLSKLKPSTKKLLNAKFAEVGKRSDVIFKLENDLFEQGFDENEIFDLIKNSVWNKFAGRHDEENQLRREIEKVKDKHPEREYTEDPFICMSDIKPEKVNWLWFPYIPENKVTLLEGDPGLGKSWFTYALSSVISLGNNFPGDKIKKKPNNVLLLSAEDGLSDTIRPRLDKFKADVRKIYATNKSQNLDEDGLFELREQVERYKPKLMIIDPIVSFMGNADLNKANETRQVMSGLAMIAQECKVTIVAVRHLTKGNRDKSIYRGIGSIDITAAARSVLLVGRHPQNNNERVVCHIKSNLAGLGRSILYRLSPNKKNPFKWCGESSLTPEDIMNVKSTGNGVLDLEPCIEFIKEHLESGPKYYNDIVDKAKTLGFTQSMVDECKDKFKCLRNQWTLV